MPTPGLWLRCTWEAGCPPWTNSSAPPSRPPHLSHQESWNLPQVAETTAPTTWPRHLGPKEVRAGCVQEGMGSVHRTPASSRWDFCSLSCLAVGPVVTVITCRPRMEGPGEGRGAWWTKMVGFIAWEAGLMEVPLAEKRTESSGRFVGGGGRAAEG